MPANAIATLSKSRPPPIAALLGGRSLPKGTYYALGAAGGVLGGSVFMVSPIRCQDVMLGPAPSDTIATCVADDTAVGAWFVADPRALKP